MKADIITILLIMVACTVYACTSIHVEGDNNVVTTEKRLRSAPALKVETLPDVRKKRSQ